MEDDLETVTLRTELASVLIECHKDGLTPLKDSLSRQVLREFADVIAEKLRRRIGGRYVPKIADRDGRVARNAAVWAAFTGRNHKELMSRFNISRRLLYSILSEQREKVRAKRHEADRG